MYVYPTIYYGPIINPTSLDAYTIHPRALIAVGSTGCIDWIVDDVPAHTLQDTLAAKGHPNESIFPLKDGEFFIPGFVDTHTHAPQVPNMGTGGQYQLLDWLKNCTFPMEAKFSNTSFAQTAYESVVRRFIDAGTTTCCYYGTLHLESTKVLADVVHTSGQRAFVGKCNMNREAPEYYVEPSVEVSLESTRALISHIRGLSTSPASNQEPLLQPILTPRFAISCSDTLLNSLGELASSDPTLRIQTHISENPSEVAYTRELFHEATSYADVYDRSGLLKDNTILAHAVHLTKDEVELIKERNSGISHCPTSNFNLSSGVAPIGEYLDKGIKVGLGTDVSGGFSISMLNAVQQASIAAKVRAIQHPPLVISASDVSASKTTFSNKPLPIPTLFYLATAGGANVCGLQNQIGTLVEGKSFDALLVSVREDVGNKGIWSLAAGEVIKDEDKVKLLEGWLERFLFCGDDRNIERVYCKENSLVAGPIDHRS